MNKIKEFFEDILNQLRDTSFNHSIERYELAKERLTDHRRYMNNEIRWNPYLHFDEWEQNK